MRLPQFRPAVHTKELVALNWFAAGRTDSGFTPVIQCVATHHAKFTLRGIGCTAFGTVNGFFRHFWLRRSRLGQGHFRTAFYAEQGVFFIEGSTFRTFLHGLIPTAQ